MSHYAEAERVLQGLGSVVNNDDIPELLRALTHAVLASIGSNG